MDKIKIILVDDHALFRMGASGALASCPDICIAGEAECAAELFDLLKHRSADIVLLDIILPDMNGIDIARRLKKDFPYLKILAVSAENSAETVTQMLNIGIEGFINKRYLNGGELAQAIRSVADGQQYFGKDISAIIYKIYVARCRDSAHTASAEMTKREREVIELCRQGKVVKEIADLLCISPRTVEYYKKNIFAKLGLHSTMEMVQYALKNGIISME